MQICRRRSRSNRLTSSGSPEEIARVSTRFRPHGKSTTASPTLGMSHHGERGRAASIVKLRCDRSRKTRSASARRAPGAASGTSLPVSSARWKSAGWRRMKAQPTARSRLVAPPNWRSCSRSEGGRGGEADPAAAHEGEGGRAERLGGREERALLHPQLEVLEAERHAPRAPGLRAERQVDEAVDLARLLPAHDRPAPPAPLHREPPVGDPRPRLGRREHLDVGVEPGRPFRRGRPPEEAQHRLVRGEGERRASSSTARCSGAAKSHSASQAADVAGLPGRLDPPEERGRVRVGRRGPGASPGQERRSRRPARAARAGRRGRRVRGSSWWASEAVPK